jgi:hypothetical protein
VSPAWTFAVTALTRPREVTPGLGKQGPLSSSPKDPACFWGSPPYLRVSPCPQFLSRKAFLPR